MHIKDIDKQVLKMHIKDININTRVYNYYFDNLIKAKKGNKNILIDDKTHEDMVMNLLYMFTVS